MDARWNRFLVLLALTALLFVPALGCDQEEDDDDDTVAEGTPPEIVHEPIPDGQQAFVEVSVECTVTDDVGVSAVTLYYRPAGTEDWNFAYLNASTEPGQYVGKIAASVVSADGVDYYIRAVDSGVPRAEAYSPDGAPEIFHHFDVEVVGQALPFVEDWEGGSLSELGWLHVEQAMGDYTWEVSGLYAWSGGYSAMHKEGINGVPIFQDWLISPPLEYDGSIDVAVSWYELGLYTGDMEVHSLYVSTSGNDPDDGDFVLVQELEAPLEEEWDSSQLYEITDLIAEGVFYVAFYYEGEYPADKWFVDDVYVGEPIARFELDEAAVEPTDFGPGDTIDITLTVSNVSLVDSLEIDASLVSDDSMLDLGAASVQYGVIPSGGSSSGDSSFAVTIDAEHPDNTLLELTLRLDDGEHTWDLPFDVMMGAESYATVDYDASISGEVILTVGHGDPDAPVFEVSAEVGDASIWTTDVTAEAWNLPPDAGENRWWVRVQNDGLYPALINGFEIDAGGEVTASTDVPFEVLAQSMDVLYLPPLAVIEATAVVTEPEVVEPGATGVELTIRLTNLGDVPTAGVLTGTLTSADPDVSNVSAGGLLFGADALEPGEVALNDTAFTFDVDAGHTDDSDLEFTLSASDGVDAYEIPVLVPVPWAHVELEELIVDDSLGNGDGILDRGETVTLTAVLRNTGDNDVVDPLVATIVQSATSEAVATITDGTEEVADGILAGDLHVATAAYELTLDSGYMGDDLLLDVELSDGIDTWTQAYELEVSARAWTAITGAEDAMGDANGYMFDVGQLHYKTDGEMLWIKADSYTPFTTDTLWLTFAFYDVPNWWTLEYHYAFGGFRLLDDWFDGWFAGDEVTPSVPIEWETEQDGGTYSFIFRVLLEDMEVDGHSLRLGVHAGSCPFVYYCDTSACSGADSDGDGMTDCFGSSDAWFWLDLANALYNQDNDNLYIFTW
jgi:hypothetical protein